MIFSEEHKNVSWDPHCETWKGLHHAILFVFIKDGETGQNCWKDGWNEYIATLKENLYNTLNSDQSSPSFRTVRLNIQPELQCSAYSWVRNAKSKSRKLSKSQFVEIAEKVHSKMLSIQCDKALVNALFGCVK